MLHNQTTCRKRQGVRASDCPCLFSPLTHVPAASPGPVWTLPAEGRGAGQLWAGSSLPSDRGPWP